MLISIFLNQCLYRSRFATNPSGSGVPGPSQPVGRYPTYSRPVIVCTGTKKLYLEVGKALGTQLQERRKGKRVAATRVVPVRVQRTLSVPSLGLVRPEGGYV